MTRNYKVSLSVALILACVTSVDAGPLDGNVVAGNVTIQGQNTPVTTVTQQTPRAIVNWRSFNVGTGETVRFVQPDASSIILNRVTGNLGPTQIHGTLTANGRVFIVNPDGILIGSGARIDTAGFLASIHDIRNDDFVAGNYRFIIPGRPDASIVNLGRINAHSQGFAALVAPAVRNDGVITARLGKIALASANEFVLDFYGDRLIQLSVNDAIASKVRDVATGEVLTSLVANNGKLKANGGQIQLTAVTARQIVDAVVSNRGVIEANTVSQRNGVIILGAPTAKTKQQEAPVQNVVVAGTISAQGKKKNSAGGHVEITGESIELSGANVNATGKANGGKILIGGDLSVGQFDIGLAAQLNAEREKKAIPTATTVKIDTLTILNASALSMGTGGKIVVWADGSTNFAGLAVSRGGENSGDGGFIEVSGKKNLSFSGQVDLRSEKGKRGVLFLDPEDITIGGPIPTITTAALETALANGSVFLQTNDSLSGSGDITIASNITWSSNNALALIAYRNIVLNNAVVIKNTGSAPLLFYADSTGTGTGTVVVNGAAAFVDFSSQSGTSFPTFAIFHNPSGPNKYANALPIPKLFFVPKYDPAVFQQLRYTMLVNSLSDLNEIRQNLSASYMLGRNIDASGTATWNNGKGFIPIGDELTPFTGSITSAWNSTINGLTINSPDLTAVGLFGVNAGSISLIGLTNVSIVGPIGAAVGALVGKNRVDPLIANSGYIRQSYSTGNIGWNGLTVPNFGPPFSFVTFGGLVGFNELGAVVRQSFARTSVVAVGDIGGLVGRNNGSLLQVYSLGAVGSAETSNIGGLVGQNSGSISEAYATGLVASTSNPSSNLGGLIGYQGGSQSFSYWNAQTSLQLNAAGYDPLFDPNINPILLGRRNTASLKAALPFGFDPMAWRINPGVSYPYFQWQEPATIPITSITSINSFAPVSSPLTSSPSQSSQNKTIPPSIPIFANDQINPHPGRGDKIVNRTDVHAAILPTSLDINNVTPAPGFGVSLKTTSDGILKLDGLQPWFGTTGAISIQALSEYALPFAQIAQKVYDSRSEDPSGWKAIAKQLGFSSEEISHAEQSGFKAMVLSFDGRTVVAFAGTDVRDIYGDVTTDFQNFLGRETVQYKFAVLFVSALQKDSERFPNILLTGHSMGGGEAAYAASLLKLPAITFNPAQISKRSIDRQFVLNFQIENDFAGFGLTASTLRAGHVISFDKSLLSTYGIFAPGTVGSKSPHSIEASIALLEKIRVDPLAKFSGPINSTAIQIDVIRARR